MAAIREKIKPEILKPIRKLAAIYSGKAMLVKNTGISKPTILALLKDGKARPDVIKKLENYVNCK